MNEIFETAKLYYIIAFNEENSEDKLEANEKIGRVKNNLENDLNNFLKEILLKKDK